METESVTNLNQQAKLCGVCSDKALGFNFNALTCESCKAFFRRNALRNKTFRCITAGNCVLNPKTRKYCRKCRLDKCFSIGMKKDWILTEEEKVMKRRKHRSRDFEKKDADSSSMTCPSPENRTSAAVKGSSSSSGGGQNASQNIIILPILPLSLSGKNDASDVLSSLNKQEILSYINDKLNINLDNVNIEAFGPNGSRSSNTLGSGPGGGSAIIVYPNQSANDGSIAGKSAAVPETSEAMLYRDGNQSSSENSSCSFTGAFGSSTAATTTVASTSFEASAQAAGDMQLVSIETMASSSSSSNSTSVQGSYVGMHSTAVVAMETQHPNQQQQNLLGPSNGMEGGSKEGGTGYQSAYKISDNVYKHAIQLEYTRNPLKYEMSGQDDRGLRKLNNLEENRLDEVNQHLRPLCAYVEGNRENKKFITDISEGLQCFEQAIKRIIMAVKNIHSFKCMCQDDQIALLKGSVGEIKGLLNIRYFNPTQELCIVPNPSDPNSILIIDHGYLKKTYGEELYNRCKAFFCSFLPEWKADDNILNLMAMILLFYPNRPNLCHREYIILEHLTYSHLLQRYLECKYSSVCQAKEVYLKLMSRLEEMHDLNSQCFGLILRLADPKCIGPLTVELFDLQIQKDKE